MKKTAFLLVITCAFIIDAGVFSYVFAQDAVDGGSYDIKDGTVYIKENNISCSITGTSSEHHVTVVKGNTGAVINLSDANLDLRGKEDSCIRIEENAGATVNVTGTCTLKSGHERGAGQDNGHAAIYVHKNAVLTLNVNGKLYAYGGDGGENRGAAAIGGDDDQDSGTITINIGDGGELYCEGGDGAAAIGGGDGYSANKPITITTEGSGKLTAKAVSKGSGGGAGIGGGDGGSTNSSITIDMKGTGSITAEGSNGGAGIGGGKNHGCGDITITMADSTSINAAGHNDAAGIGGGDDGSVPHIYIFGSTVSGSDHTKTNTASITATGESGGAGIGGGSDGRVEGIHIKDIDTLNVTGGADAPGIGPGHHDGTGDGGDCGTILIERVSKINANGGSDAAAIGGSHTGKVNSLIIDAQDSEINATGGAAGIGGGDNGSIGDITISNINKSITAKAGDEGAGIGGCNAANGDISLGLEGGSITAKGGCNGAGIGGGDDVSGAVIISGWGSIDATGGFDAAAIGGGEGKDCGSIMINGDSAYQDVTDADIRNGSFDDKTFALKIDARACEEDRHISSYLAPNIGGKNSGSINIQNADINCYYPGYAAMYGASIGCGKEGSVSNGITISHSRLRQNSGEASRNYNVYGPMVGEGYGGSVSTIELNNVHCHGGAIGGAAWNGGDINSISITDSNIYADAADTAAIVSSNKLKYADPLAGIGSGKDAGIGSITISGSKINAYGKSGGAGIGSGGFYSGDTNITNMFKTGGKCGSITISDSEVEARGAMGGAGIGGGQMTSVTGTISISNSNVKATAVDTDYSKAAGAGIGGGGVAGCSDISISGSTVDASTVNASAGIGSGGVMNANFFGGILEACWDAEVGNIDIENSTVTAAGGTNGAGIGNGWGSQQDGSKHINIKDSTVSAKGGSFAAGIGGGNNSEFERGGSISNISITGRSCVEASGGDEAAGIGGGSQGELHGCTIELDESTKDGENGKKTPKYYVKAWGGAGAAGIGSGASHAMDMSGMFEGAHIAEDITVNKGFVYARGGGDKQLSNSNGDYWIGAGAGIGGGGRAGVKSLKICGGIIKTECQSSEVMKGVEAQTRQACGIGHGGGYAPWAYADTDCTSIDLYGGTVEGRVCEQTTKYITGGSVRDNIGGDQPDDPKTQGSDGKKVFRNTLNIENGLLSGSPVDFMGTTYYPVSLEKTNISGYGQWATDSKNVYAIGRGDKPELSQLFLWLKAGATNASYADIGGYSDGKTRHYYGTTKDKDNTNLLKQGRQIDMRPYPEGSEQAAVGDEFTLCISLTAGDPIDEDTQFEYSISGDSNAEFVKEEQQQNGTRLITVKPANTGDLIVEAKLGDGDDVYWGTSAKYSGTVGAKKAEIVINKDPSKVYDGQPVSISTDAASGEDKPDISVTPEAARSSLTVKYYDSEGNELKDETGEPKAPAEPGDYTASVSVAAGTDGADQAWSANSESCSFTISKYRSWIKVSGPDRIVFTYDLNGQPVAAQYEVEALNTAEGTQPSLTYESDSGIVSCEWARMTDDGSYVVINGAPSEAGYYRMKLTAPETAHYTAAESTVYFRVADQLETDISITMQSKTYDGKPAAAPDIQTNRRESELHTVYYKKSGDSWTELLEAPADAGEYKVEVSAPVNKYFKGKSAGQEFSIVKRTVLLAASASRIYDTDGSPTDGAKIRVEVVNGIQTMVTDGVKVRVSVKTSSGQVITKDASVTGPDKSGKYFAEVSFENVGAGNYDVSAEISDDPNFASVNREKEFDKELRTYDVDVKNSSVGLDEGVFDLKVTVTDPLGLEGGYSIGYSVEDGSGLGDEFRENVVRVVDSAGKPQLKVTGAGKALVKVTVTPDEDPVVHAVSEGYAVITVSKGSFDIAVTADDKDYDGHSRRVDTRLVYKGDYPVSYSGSTVVRHYDAFGPEEEVSEMTGGNPVDVGVYTALVYAPGDDNFESSLAGDRYEITPAKIKISTGSASKVYDGKPLTCDKADISGLVNGEKALINATGSQTEIGSSTNTYTLTWAEDDPGKATAKESNYATDGEELGTLTVIDPALLYAFTDGAGSSWKKGSGKDLKFTVERSVDNEAAFSHFSYIMVDGKKADSSSYSAKPGSVKLSLKAKYLQKLSNGKYTVTAVFDDGTADAEFTVSASDEGESDGASDGGASDDGTDRSGVRTGDENMVLLWAAVMITAAMLLICLVIIRRRKA